MTTQTFKMPRSSVVETIEGASAVPAEEAHEENQQAPYEKLVFTPPPLQRMTNPETDSQTQPQQPTASEKVKATKRSEAETDNDDEEEDDEDDGEEIEEEEDDEEELNVRDSVFVFSGNAQNQVPDWSYIDEQVLMSYVNNINENKDGETNSTKKKSKGSKKDKSKEDKKESSPAATEPKLETVPEETADAVEGETKETVVDTTA